jgi:UDP-N-acetylmuramate dehydrogenase
MMAATATGARWIDRLPPVRGRLTAGAPLAKSSWFRCGGPAEVLFRPADSEDLAAVLRATPSDIPVTVIGVGSNLLVRDGGVDGVVVRLGRSFARIAVAGTAVRAGAAALDLKVALAAQAAGLAGLEFLSGIPGTIGGSVRMNAGAFGHEMTDVVIEAAALDRQGTLHHLSHDELGFAYRRSALPDGWIVTEVLLRAAPGDARAIAEHIAEIREAREAAQPTRLRTGGSTFTNPPGGSAWELIDRAGCRGLRRGAAMVSEKHCNFLVNTGGASAADIEALGEDVRRRVFETSGVRLHWEIHRIGRPAPDRLAVPRGRRS